MKKITTLFISLLLCLLFSFQLIAQSNSQAPTLSAGLDNVAFNKGTLDVELIAKIIAEKQKEIVREGIKRMIYEYIGSSELDDYSQFYIERITTIIFQEKNHKVMTKRILEETTNYLFVLGSTKLFLKSEENLFKYFFDEGEKILNIKTIANLNDTITIELENINVNLEKNSNVSVRNHIIKTILTICSEIPQIKELGLLNNFNYYEHFEIYNSSLKSEKANFLAELFSYEKLIDFSKIAAIKNIEQYTAHFKSLLIKNTEVPAFFNKKVNIRKIISILKVYYTIKKIIKNSNLLKDITSKSGIQFSSLTMDMEEIIKEYESLNIYSKNSADLIFNNTQKNDYKIALEALQQLILKKTANLEQFNNTVKEINEERAKITNVSNNIKFNIIGEINMINHLKDDSIYKFTKQDLFYSLLQSFQEENKLVSALLSAKRTSNDSIIFEKEVLDIFLTTIEKNTIDLTSLQKSSMFFQKAKNFFYVEDIKDAQNIAEMTFNDLKSYKNHQKFIGDLLSAHSGLFNTTFFTTTCKDLDENYKKARNIYKLSQGISALYKHLINDDQELITFIKTIKEKDYDLLNLYNLKEILTDKSKAYDLLSEYHLKLRNNTLKNTTKAKFSYPKDGLFKKNLIKLKNFIKKTDLTDIHNLPPEKLFNFIKEKIDTINLSPKENIVLTSNELKSLKKLYTVFIDRSFKKNIDNINIINILDKDFLAELLVLSNKLTNSADFKKIIKSIDFSLTSLMIKKIKSNEKILSSKNINNVLNFLKFIGNIKELDKAETFTYLLKTMNDYEYLFRNANGEKKLIPDLINSLREYAIVDLDNNSIEIDVASVLTHLLEKYQNETSNWSFYATVGLNQNWAPNGNLIDNNGKPYNSFNTASEKIGVKYKLWNFNRSPLYQDKLFHNVKRKALVSDIYVFPYVSGIMYKIADTSGKGYNSSNIGAAIGLTFFNSLDFNINASLPMEGQVFKNHILGFSFDIPLSEYLKRL